MTIQSDISGQIARWLFRLGIIWGVLITVAFFLTFRVGPYYLLGFVVWLGWRWRSRQQPALRAAAGFWLFSAAFNAAFVGYYIATGLHWTRVLFYDPVAFFAWWWIAVTLASLVALAFEFTLQRHETVMRIESKS